MGVYADIRDAIEARIVTVSDYGVVHDYERYNANWSEYFGHFKSTIDSTAQIRGWVVTWNGIPDAQPDGQNFGNIAEVYRFTVRGLQGLADSSATEKTFYSLVEQVKDAIRSRKDFGLSSVIDYTIVVTIPVLDIRMFGSVLCNYCELQVQCIVEQVVTFG